MPKDPDVGRKLTGDNGRRNAALRKIQSCGQKLTTDMNAFFPLALLSLC